MWLRRKTGCECGEVAKASERILVLEQGPMIAPADRSANISISTSSQIAVQRSSISARVPGP